MGRTRSGDGRGEGLTGSFRAATDYTPDGHAARAELLATTLAALCSIAATIAAVGRHAPPAGDVAAGPPAKSRQPSSTFFGGRKLLK